MGLGQLILTLARKLQCASCPAGLTAYGKPLQLQAGGCDNATLAGEETMNVFDFAMKMEEDGKSFYETLAQKASLEGLKTIFPAWLSTSRSITRPFRS